MEQRLLKIGADSLKKAALNEDAKEFILKNETLFGVLKKAADRYIGGETINETLSSVREWNQKGFDVTTDFIGESIRNEKDANDATTEFVNFAKAIGNEKLNSSISLDLSHIGLLISKDLAMENLKTICKQASEINQEVIISMEGTHRTDNILNIYKETLKTHKNLGITL
jgi:proline dehydrogenase